MFVSKFFITHLYPQQMSIYGDMGNILAIQHRLKRRGFEVVYQTVDILEPLPKYTDFYFIGGGQDNEQYLIFQDLLSKKERLLGDIKEGVSLLSICGGYQLLGESFLTGDGRQIEGIGLFPVKTIAPDASVKSRCIGNIVVQCNIPELDGYKLVGFENHGGQTYFSNEELIMKNKEEVPPNPLSGGRGRFETLLNKKSLDTAYPIGKTLVGFGNNAKEGHEGCVYKNAIGTYLHGSCLPKNPQLADWLISRAMSRNGSIELVKIDDSIAEKTRDNLLKRFCS